MKTDYEIYGVKPNGDIDCFLLCESHEIDMCLKTLKEKYPKIKTWIYGINIYVRTVQ